MTSDQADIMNYHFPGFSTATRAAAAGGVTTLVDMPLNSLPPTTTPANLKVKAEAALGQCWVNVKGLFINAVITFWCCLVQSSMYLILKAPWFYL